MGMQLFKNVNLLLVVKFSLLKRMWQLELPFFITLVLAHSYNITVKFKTIIFIIITIESFASVMIICCHFAYGYFYARDIKLVWDVKATLRQL